MSVEQRNSLVVRDCLLSGDEIQYLRSLSCASEVTREVEQLQDDIYCANKARTEKIYAGLGLADATTNGQILQIYADQLPDQGGVLAIFTNIDTAQSLQDDDKAFLKAMVIVRALLEHRNQQRGSGTTEESCDVTLAGLDSVTDLKRSICSLGFWRSLWQFQQETGSKNDCIIGRRTLRALGAYVPKREIFKQQASPLQQHFSAPGFQEYVQQRTNEIGKQAYLCSGYTNGMLTELLHVQHKTYSFPEQESSAREKDDDLRAPWFTKTSLALLNEQKIKAKLTNCPIGTTLTVQNSCSKHQSHGVTHTLIHLGGGTRSEQIGPNTYTLSDLGSRLELDSETGTIALKRNEGQRYRFVASEEGKTTGSALYEPNLDQLTTVTFRTLNAQEFGAIKKRHNGNGVEIAKYLAKTYGGSYMYYLSIFGTHVADNLTIQVPIPKGTDREQKNHFSSADILIYQNNLALEKSPFKDSEQVLNDIGVVLSDNDRGMLGAIYGNERNGGRKRKASEWYLSSSIYRNRLGNISRWFNPINMLVSLGLVAKGHADIATGKKDITSFGPFQIKIDVFKALMRDSNIQNNLHKILEKEGFNKWYRALKGGRRQGDNLASLSYQDVREILYNEPAALYLAYELCKQNVTTINTRANSAGLTVRKSDVYLTGQLMYNVGPSATYGAILQQELYKIAKEHHCSPPENFVFDGSDGPQTQALLTCVRDLIGDDVAIEKKSNGRISHLVVGDEHIDVEDVGGLAGFFAGRTYAHTYYPALDFGFLQDMSQYSGKKVRAHYVSNAVKNATREDRTRYYTGTIESGSDPRIQRLRSLIGSSAVNYRSEKVDGLKNDFNPLNNTGDLDCVDLVKLYHAQRNKKEWRKSVDPKLKDYTDFTSMFADQFRIHGFITPQIYGNQNRYKDMLHNIRVGDVIGIGHERSGGKQVKRIQKPMSMSHGGVVSRIERNSAGEVVNVWMLHSSGTEDLGGIGPTEVKLFGPGGYYESVCDYQNPLSTKNTIVFGGLKGRSIVSRNNGARKKHKET